MKKTIFLISLTVLAVILAIGGCERKVVVEENDLADNASCFTCHGDDNLAIVQANGQWEHSQHASGETLDRKFPMREIIFPLSAVSTVMPLIRMAT